MLYLGNAFSLGMLYHDDTTLKVYGADLITVKSLLQSREWQSCIGHASTADLLSNLLDMKIEMNRINVKLQKDDVIIVFQLMQRLEEGKVLSKEELQNLSYKFYVVEVVW